MNKSWWWLAAFIIVGLLFGLGVIFLVTRPPRGEPVKLIPAPTLSPITIYVRGAVNNPGLYQVPSGSRINDAIQVAGGFIDNADISTVNLAKILEDGDEVIIPELPSPATTENGTRSINPINNLVNINTATIEQLDTLPEIGPKTAQNIINYRDANGPFEKTEDIMNVDGIGQAIFNEIKDMITTGTSP
jgi:competence protein ComEA